MQTNSCRDVEPYFGIITSLLDDIHVILWHIPYPSGSYRVCLFVQIILIERMSLVMIFFGFHHILLDATLRHIPRCREHLEVVGLCR